MVREKRDIRPVILKFGVALAISLGGILFTFFRTKRIKHSNSSSSPNSGELQNDDQTNPALGNSVSEFPWKFEDVPIPKIIIGSSISSPSTNCRSGGDKDGLLLPEINELEKEFGSPPKASFSPLQGADSPKEYKIVGRDVHEQEIKNLKNIVKTLKERDRTREIQLLEYYGCKEQEKAMMELQNRMKIHNLESKHLGLKIETLKAEKMKLEAQVAEYAKVASDLEAAKLKIKQLEKKLRLGAGHNKEQILSFKERVLKLENKEKNPVQAESNVQLELQKLKDLEIEADELRKSNQSLRAENSTVGDRLEYVQLIAISAMEDNAAEALKEESLQLRKQNEDLVKKIDQIQEGHYSDVEQVAYLRWINACLRYELRNFKPAPGETTARDLSKTLSPESRKKAKQLIVEYAAKEDQGDRGIHVLDLDSGQLSSQEPYLMNSGEFDGTSIANSSTHKTDTSNKSTIFHKVMRIIRGKDHHHNHSEMVHKTEENAARCSYYSSGYCSDMSVVDTGAIRPQSRSRTPSPGPSKQLVAFHSFDQGSTTNKGESRNYPTRRRRYSDVGSLDYISKRLAESPQEKGNNHDQENVHKSELAKYAEALKGSRSKEPVRKRSASVSFF
ncbi:protein CHUP1, chloroplastic-like isoform X1 [Solanum pennellii]|uniref:Protein CHUP1, chloroplastic-like isoform X1 n=1 Tax=Solanum pennellii TaxID=28526 RepID=A0ABM1GYW6_SOLPN|nr:protein CHUP1, chloroplastic-like isoform X1 [Solanum pennellii]